MKQLKYKEAYDLIIDAYFKDEIEPMRSKFCICGTLAGGDSWCRTSYRKEEHFYSRAQYVAIELALLTPLIPFGVIPGGLDGWWFGNLWTQNEGYEDALFKGMSDALDVLKSIHEQRGEVIDEQPVFTKRELHGII